MLPPTAPVYSRPQPPPAPPAPPPDPHTQALEARWKEFEAQDYEGRFLVFSRTLEEPELMDDEMAFEMLNQLHSQSAEHRDWDRFPPLVNALRVTFPEIYAHDAHYYLSWLISDALAAGRTEHFDELTRELAASTGKQIDLINNVLDQLAYHGRLANLLEIMRIGWPLVKESKDILPWGVEHFADRAAIYEVFAYVENTSSPDPYDPALIERLRNYVGSLDIETHSRYLQTLTGTSKRDWKSGDFEIRKTPKKSRDGWDDDFEADKAEQSPDPGRDNLYFLTVEFLGHVHRQEGVPFTKGELVRSNILRYLVQRLEGELGPKQSMLEAAIRPWKHRPKQQKPEHSLCPDRETLDRYLASLFGFMNPQYYEVAATFELVPAWLRFLQARQLLSAEQRQKAFQDLAKLKGDLLKYWESFPTDPTPLMGLKMAWEEGKGLAEGTAVKEKENLPSP